MDRIGIIKNIADKLSNYDNIDMIAKKDDNVEIFLEQKMSVYDETSLSHGLPAVCMLFAELNEVFPNEKWDYKAHYYLMKLQEYMEEGRINNLSMFSGYAGIGLMALCLSKDGTRYTKLINAINERFKQNIDGVLDVLYNMKYCNMSDYDVISGLSGMIGYTVTQESLKEVNEKVGKYLIYRCQDITYKGVRVPGFYIPQENQFLEREKEIYKDGNFNLGLSHGMPGILLALCQLKDRGYIIEGINEAIEKCANFLMKYINQANNKWNGNITFAELCANKVASAFSRDAWCYGSPGVSYALYVSGCVLNNNTYKEKAVDVMKGVANTIEGINSATFCHGLAGLIYIYIRFYELTKDETFYDTIQVLKEQLWDFYSENNFYGFKNDEMVSGSSTDQVGLLTGVSGVLLTLLAVEGYKNTQWDNAFLLGKLVNEKKIYVKG